MTQFVNSLGKIIETGTGIKMGKYFKSSQHSDQSLDEETILLHGNLEVTIVAGRDLPNLDRSILSTRKDVSDPFVSCTLGTHKIFVTSVKPNNLNPEWDEKFSLLVCHDVRDIVLDVWDQDVNGDELMGSVKIEAQNLLEGEVSGWNDIINKNKKGKTAGQLNILMKFTDVSSLPKQYQIEAYFPVRSNCGVNLYSCARNSPVPVQLSDGEEYQPASCYKDIYRSILGAEKFIHIAGWSVWKDLRLIRDSDLEDMDVLERNMASMTLGELLIMKAKSGVKVAVMVWACAVDMMGTHDKDTASYFQGTLVQCCRVSRDIYQEQSGMADTHKKWTANASYTHHQKTVILDSAPTDEDQLIASLKDSEVKGKKRTIVAYVGGLDLTDGRYDTPEHPLFNTLLGDHKEDFYQGSAVGIMANTGPRQPWQDIHSKITGRAAMDVNANFKERWVRQNNGQLEMLYAYGEINEQEFDLETEQGDWNVQLLRSITDDSAFLHRHPTLITQKTTLVDISIMKGYVNAIRSAEKYIYIENQYFLGSAYAWYDYNQIDCHNGIPAEIVAKVVSKILKGEEFVAYIAIPLHPEGNPHDEPTQEILAWQRRTMTMMYKRIGLALKQMGSSKHPTDYLMFFCLIKKEKVEDIPEELRTPIAGTSEDKLRKSRRFMIYIHSKFLIVDDSMVIIGTANINQRSLAGARDSEIAVSCLQPEHTLLANDGNLPQGDIAKFRMRLFEEHLGSQDAVLKEPHSEACVKFIKDTCSKNWEMYFDDESPGGAGQLICYPKDISQEGEVKPMENCVYFPDTKAKIAGTVSHFLPKKLTT